VVVFDDRVTYERLRGIPVLFLSGLGISAATQEAVSRCVAEGATCVGPCALLPAAAAGTMAPNAVRKDGAGVWVSATDFLADHVRKHVAHVLPKEDVITYQFARTRVTLRPRGGDMNALEGELTG